MLDKAINAILLAIKVVLIKKRTSNVVVGIWWEFGLGKSSF